MPCAPIVKIDKNAGKVVFFNVHNPTALMNENVFVTGKNFTQIYKDDNGSFGKYFYPISG